MLAGDDPVIGSVCPELALYDESSSATLWAKDVASTGSIERVWAVITPPGYTQGSPGVPVTDLPCVDLIYDAGSGRYEWTYDAFLAHGDYEIAVYARALGQLIEPIVPVCLAAYRAGKT